MNTRGQIRFSYNHPFLLIAPLVQWGCTQFAPARNMAQYIPDTSMSDSASWELLHLGPILSHTSAKQVQVAAGSQDIVSRVIPFSAFQKAQPKLKEEKSQAPF